MGVEEIQAYEAMGSREMNGSDFDHFGKWVIMESDEDDEALSSTIGSSLEDSINSLEFESSSSELAEDASSSSISNSSSFSSSSLSSGPLYELSELMANLPIKRGLSKFYQGKSQSFTSLAKAKSLEDLAKRGVNRKKKIKSCKSYGAALDAHKFSYSPKAVITKKPSKSSFLSHVCKRSNHRLLDSH